MSTDNIDTQTNSSVAESNTTVTPWSVVTVGKIDYQKLIEQFGTEPIEQNLIDKFERITGKPAHPWIKRGIFFSHRALNDFLDAYEAGHPVFLYTGRGPTSTSLHTGHMVPFIFTKYLQDTFDCPLVIQIADDEKFYFKDMEFDDVYKLGFENAKDIIAFGFNPEKTFIFSNRDYRLFTPEYEIFASSVTKFAHQKTIAKIFGFDETATLGMYNWPIYQSIAAFSRAFPHIFNGRPAHCLVAYAIDQDPYFRLARDIATKMNLIKPCSIMSTFLDPLTGPGKMSSSTGDDSTLFLTDTAEEIRNKVMKYAFSGGGGDGSLEQHKKFGGNPDIDISCQYLRYFELNDDVLADIFAKFKSGELTCSDTKKILADKLIPIIITHQETRKNVSQETLEYFYQKRQMELPTPKQKTMTPDEQKLYALLDANNIKHETMYHNVITTMQEGEEIARNLKGTVCKNLFLAGPNNTYYLYIIDANTVVDMKNLHKKLGIAKVRFAEASCMQQILGVPKGCATIFGLMNDTDKKINVVIGSCIPKDLAVNFHPMRNDATTTILYDDMLKFVNILGYSNVMFI
jgi:tryptophanyl-tRNA synthetase